MNDLISVAIFVSLVIGILIFYLSRVDKRRSEIIKKFCVRNGFVFYGNVDIFDKNFFPEINEYGFRVIDASKSNCAHSCMASNFFTFQSGGFDVYFFDVYTLINRYLSSEQSVFLIKSKNYKKVIEICNRRGKIKRFFSVISGVKSKFPIMYKCKNGDCVFGYAIKTIESEYKKINQEFPDKCVESNGGYFIVYDYGRRIKLEDIGSYIDNCLSSYERLVSSQE